MTYEGCCCRMETASLEWEPSCFSQGAAYGRQDAHCRLGSLEFYCFILSHDRLD